MISQIFVVVCMASAISAQVVTQTTTFQPSSTTFVSTPYTSTGMPSSTWSSTTWQPSSTTEQPKQSDACCAINECNYEKIEIVQKLLALASSLENSIKAPAECRQQSTTTMTTEYPTTTTFAPAPLPALAPVSIGSNAVPA